jgi:tRNA (cmo5U34)-methyltransferase
MNVGEAFSKHAQIYDRSRRQLIPCFDDYYGMAVAQAPFPADAELRVIDLGAGTGLMTAHFAAAFTRARFTLVDLAPDMLARARERLGDGDRYQYLQGDYIAWPFEGNFDLVISCLSIHHLEDDAKRRLFARVADALQPGGAFINADEVRAQTDAAQQRTFARWLLQVRDAGAPEDDIAAALERKRFDRLVTVGDQLAWMSDAGLRDVDCVYKYLMFAVMCGFA